jgi:cyclopropane fatty-acyl-phospholipid synthase-like methyltransferase
MLTSTAQKPTAPACERNRQPILDHLQTIFTDVGQVLEVGSGTGQHAVFFAQHLSHLHWQPSDRAENLAGIAAWCSDAQLPNLRMPLELDIDKPWPLKTVDAIFSANTLHIMNWRQVQVFFKELALHLAAGGKLVVYGPFNYNGRYTSESNAQFDKWLKLQSPYSAIRDFEAVDALAKAAGLTLVADHEMPANNRLLHWVKVGATQHATQTQPGH